MTGVRIEYDQADLQRLDNYIEKLLAVPGAMQSAYASIGEYLLLSHRDRFDAQTDPKGKPWQPLSKKYMASKRKRRSRGSGAILRLDGYLRDLLRYDATAEGLLFGTDRIYGATHQFGDEKRGIPQREFLGISQKDEESIADILEDLLAPD